MRLGGLFVAILVLVAIVALPAVPVHSTLAQEPGTANPTRNLPYPDKVERGATFDVLVNFTCPADDFNSITMRDTAPDGWDVDIEKPWSTPPLDDFVKLDVNQVSLLWNGPYDVPKNFTAKYKVTVPCNASVGDHDFSFIYPNHTLVYHIAGSEKIAENIMGEHNVTVIDPAINFAPTSIEFYGAVNGTNPQNQTMELWSSTQCMLNWSLTDDAEWLSESPTSGNCTDEHSFITLSVNSSGMTEGEHLANITIQSSDANNPVEIVPVTLHMSVTSILKAHVNFVGRGTNNSRWVEPFEVWRFNPGTTQVVWQGNRTTNNTGWFNISDVPVGTYDIGIKNWTCLSEVANNVTVSEGVGAVVDFGTTREGDCDNDDWVTGSDRSILYIGWGTSDGMPGWNANCDFDRDGWITGADRSMMYISWGQCGDLAG